MPAKWSKYDDQPLPTPKDNPSGDGGSARDPGPAKRLMMNWTGPHTPTTVAPAAAEGGGDGNGSGGGGGNDTDSSYTNPGRGGPGEFGAHGVPSLQPTGTPDLNRLPDYDKLDVSVDDVLAYEQNILTAASNLVATFNALRDRSQTVLNEPMGGQGEGRWFVQHQQPNRQNFDNTDIDPHFRYSDHQQAVVHRTFRPPHGITLMTHRPSSEGSVMTTPQIATAPSQSATRRSSSSAAGMKQLEGVANTDW